MIRWMPFFHDYFEKRILKNEKIKGKAEKREKE